MLNTKIGIIGGGQLGKMMLLEAKKMGFYAAVLDPDNKCPARSLCDEFFCASFDDHASLRLLAETTDVLTYEFEHIDANFLLQLEKEGKRVYPTASSLLVIQDKLEQKKRLSAAGICVPDFIKINSLQDMESAKAQFGLPFMLKSRFGGYDGKGNSVVSGNLEEPFYSLDGKFLIAEKFVNFDSEISVLVCRSQNGETATYPVAENIHKNNILFETSVPAQISQCAESNARAVAAMATNVFAGVGMFCVEMFASKDDIIINEVAPRPHNSGHYTIEACETSQFEQHIRAVAGLPLGSCKLIRPAVMRNILGEEAAGKPIIHGADEALAIAGVKLHIYGKSESRPGRKMGHLTACADTLQEARDIAGLAADYIKITG